MKIILASGSPRRSEILKNAGIFFEVSVADADETLPKNIMPDKAVKYLAELKGDAVSTKIDGVIISADTVVTLDNTILGKPSDEQDAERMLKMLSGKTHYVYTGVCIQDSKRKTVFCEKTAVTFYELDEAEIKEYVATGEPMDKAGAYGIQGLGALLVKKIDGDYLNVVGLPMARLKRELKFFGI